MAWRGGRGPGGNQAQLPLMSESSIELAAEAMTTDAMSPGGGQQAAASWGAAATPAGAGRHRISALPTGGDDPVENVRSDISSMSVVGEMRRAESTGFIKEGPPPSQLLRDDNTMKDATEGIPLSDEMQMTGIPSWSKPEREDRMVDLAPKDLINQRSDVAQFGFHNRCLLVLYFLFLGLLIGYLVSIIQNNFIESNCYGLDCITNGTVIYIARNNASDYKCNLKCEDQVVPCCDFPGVPTGCLPRCTEEFCCEITEDRDFTDLNDADDWRALLVAAAGSIAAIPGFYIAFTCLRRSVPLLYDGKYKLRKAAIEQDRRTSFMVLYVAFQARLYDPEADKVIQHAGLDGWMQLRFYTLCCRILSTVGFTLVAVLCPMHVLVGRKDVDALSSFGFDRIAVNEPGQWRLFVVHGFCVWFVVWAVGSFLVESQKRFLGYRYGWLSALPKPRATTVLVENIPKEYRSDDKLKAFFQNIFPKDAVQKAYVVRRCGPVSKKYQAYRAAVEKCELTQAKWEQAGSDPDKRPQLENMQRLFRTLMMGRHLFSRDSTSVGVAARMRDSDAIRVYGREAAEARDELAQSQEGLQEACSEDNSPFWSRIGFVTFSSRKWQALAMERHYLPNTRQMECTMPPDPLDVVYTDLSITKRSKRLKSWLGGALVCLVFVITAPLFIFIVQLLDSQQLKRIDFIPYVVQIGEFIESVNGLDTVLRGAVQPVLFRALMNVIPVSLFFIIQFMFVLRAKTEMQRILQRWFFSYQVLFLVLAPIFLQTVWPVVQGLLQNELADPTIIWESLLRIESVLPRATNFYLNLLVTSWVTALVHLCRPVVLGKYILFRFLMTPVDAGIRAQDENPALFGTGVRMTKGVIFMTLSLVFCQLSPLINIIALICFMIHRVVYRYLLLKAEDKRPDTGGLYWIRSMQQLWVSLGMFVFVMSFILWIRAGTYVGAFTALAAVKLRRDYRDWCDLEWRTLPMQKIIDLDHATVQTYGHEYVQKECVPVQLDVNGVKSTKTAKSFLEARAELSFDEEVSERRSVEV